MDYGGWAKEEDHLEATAVKQAKNNSDLEKMFASVRINWDISKVLIQYLVHKH